MEYLKQLIGLKKITKDIMNNCFICEKGTLEVMLDLGQSPIANNLELNLSDSLGSKKYPLMLSKCSNLCQHVQISEIVDQVEIFSDYFYMPSVSATLTKHLEDISEDLNENFFINDKSFIVDIGSNDGTFLNSLKKFTNKILGIDPAKNLSDLANSKGINTLNDFFTNDLSIDISAEYGKADYIVSTNTFAHTPKVNDFVKGLKNLLSQKGVIIIEIHYLGSMINDNSFDTIYHEHFSYWSLKNLNDVFARFDLQIFDAKILPVHHGQLRIYISNNGNYDITDSYLNILNNEIETDLLGKGLDKFCNDVKTIKKEITHLFNKLSKEGKKIYGYGAPAKASTLINFIGAENIEEIYDKSELKQGKYIPGTSIKIKDPIEILKDKPDYIFLFAWNFSDEIVDQLKEKYNFTGKIIIPIPKLKIIDMK